MPPLQAIRAWSAFKRTVRLDQFAIEEFTRFFTQQIEPLKLQGDNALLARIDLTPKKVMLLLAANEKSETVTYDIVERATSLFTYLLTTYHYIDRRISLSAGDECAERILEVVASYPQKVGGIPPTARDIARMMSSRRFDRETVLKVIKTLCALEQIKEVRTEKRGRGRPATQYVING